jgi:hypothetical protein
VYQYKSLGSIFEGDMPLLKNDPNMWPLYDGHNRKAVNSFQAIRVFIGIFTRKKHAIQRYKKMKMFIVSKEDEGCF